MVVSGHCVVSWKCQVILLSLMCFTKRQPCEVHDWKFKSKRMLNPAASDNLTRTGTRLKISDDARCKTKARRLSTALASIAADHWIHETGRSDQSDNDSVRFCEKLHLAECFSEVVLTVRRLKAFICRTGTPSEEKFILSDYLEPFASHTRKRSSSKSCSATFTICAWTNLAGLMPRRRLLQGNINHVRDESSVHHTAQADPTLHLARLASPARYRSLTFVWSRFGIESGRAK